MAIGRNGALFFGAVLGLLSMYGKASAVKVTVNPDKEYQEFEGWGTSICWWGNVVGKYPDEKREAIMDLLFDTADGLGFSILRYNIGGGENPSHTHLQTGKKMDGYKASQSAAYDWTKDAAQRWCLDAAKKRIPDDWFIAEAFSNSPPYWMTESGCAAGNSGGRTNLKTDYFDDHADYLTEVVKHFRDEWEITFRTLQPMNEPMVGWSSGGGQEGCHIDVSLQDDLIREVKKKLDAKGLTETKISAPDETSIDETLHSWNSYDATTKSYIYQINTHVYGGSKRKELGEAARAAGKKIWDSECDGSGAPAPFSQWTHNHNDIVPGLDIAYRAIRDMRDMQINAWINWQAVESEQTQVSLNKNWGLLHADFNGGTNYSITKKYYSVKQYSGFIRPMSTMIDINNNDAVAFLSEKKDRLIIVQRNSTTNDVSYEYNVAALEGAASKASAWRTSRSENCSNTDDVPVTDGVMKTTSPAQSITTYVLPLTSTAAGLRAASVQRQRVTVGCSNATLQVTSSAPVNKTSCRLYDLSGKLIATIALKNSAQGSFKGSHDLSRLSPGNYLVEISSGGHVLHSAKVAVTR